MLKFNEYINMFEEEAITKDEDDDSDYEEFDEDILDFKSFEKYIPKYVNKYNENRYGRNRELESTVEKENELITEYNLIEESNKELKSLIKKIAQKIFEFTDEGDKFTLTGISNYNFKKLGEGKFGKVYGIYKNLKQLQKVQQKPRTKIYCLR